MSPTRHQPHSYRRKTYVEDVAFICRICLQPINRRSPHSKDLTGSRFHPVCMRIPGVRPAADRARFLNDSALGQLCEGCGCEIGLADMAKVVHVMTKAWHGECRLRR
jgi:hypothetical protein